MNIIYGVALSPFVRKVLLVLEMKNAEYNMETVLPFAAPPAYKAKHPLMLVPAFEDEYVTLADSTVICAYLDEKYPNEAAIYPSDRIERAKCRWFEEYSDTKLLELLGAGLFFERVVKPGSMKQTCDEDKVNSTINEKLPEQQNYLESQLKQSGFLFSDGLSLADISIVSQFINGEYADYQVDNRIWPKLSSYIKRVKQHPLIQHRLSEEKKVADSMGLKEII